METFCCSFPVLLLLQCYYYASLIFLNRNCSKRSDDKKSLFGLTVNILSILSAYDLCTQRYILTRIFFSFCRVFVAKIIQNHIIISNNTFLKSLSYFFLDAILNGTYNKSCSSGRQISIVMSDI